MGLGWIIRLRKRPPPASLGGREGRSPREGGWGRCGLAVAPPCGALDAPGHGYETGSLASNRTRAIGFRGFDLVHDSIPRFLVPKGVGRRYLWRALVWPPCGDWCQRCLAVVPNLRNCFIVCVLLSGGRSGGFFRRRFCRRFRRRRLTQGLVSFPGFPERQKQDGEFPRDGDDGFLFRPATA